MSDDRDDAPPREGVPDESDADSRPSEPGADGTPGEGRAAADGEADGAGARRTDAPLADLRESLAADAARDDDFEALFDEPSEPLLDGEDAWDRLLADGEPAAAAAVARGDADRDVRVIESRICHTCPYFADPPDVACTHEGTDIREVVDTAHFEVADCPMVVDADDAD